MIATGKTYPAWLGGYDKTGDIALLELQGAWAGDDPGRQLRHRAGGCGRGGPGNAEGQGTNIPAGGRVSGLGKTHHRRRPGLNSQHPRRCTR